MGLIGLLPTDEERKAAERAKKLLLRHLDAGQKREWEEGGRVTVVGSDGYTYLVSTGGVTRDAGDLGGLGCMYPKNHSHVPPADFVLGLKLFVEADVEGLRKYRRENYGVF